MRSHFAILISCLRDIDISPYIRKIFKLKNHESQALCFGGSVINTYIMFCANSGHSCDYPEQLFLYYVFL
ncbi:hypothetical protein ATCV1_z526R [Acanthocystis turfacea chlorella virus 1]|uniref:Uncharacterized protein z526R n=1 Tax=Chlorovirus heliozoae TaxID=322019 RepID=A7K9D6_9PHYC|nr:hypothetical protein ATCV1_z526R [Acanthocystis turfacea chlorella virus 1]ABT16660.1 hypothetical protein ATCV1_z526R [Acanthocystis turfacea chlorella virus 1]